MEKQKKWSRLMIGTLLLLVLAVGGTAVLAQSQDDPDIAPPADEGDTDSNSVIPNPFSRGNGENRFNEGERGERGFHDRGNEANSGEYLAEALGITVEELQAAHEAARAAALEQADESIENEGRPLRGGRFGGFGVMGELLAEELGISVEALQVAQEEAHAARLAQMVEDGEITQEEADLIAARKAVRSYLDVEGMQAAAQEAYEAAVNEALDAGEITQELADQLLSDAAAGPGFGGFGGHRGHGSHGGRGMMPHGNSGSPSGTANTADNNA